jgi:hypothetical protein
MKQDSGQNGKKWWRGTKGIVATVLFIGLLVAVLLAVPALLPHNSQTPEATDSRLSSGPGTSTADPSSSSTSAAELTRAETLLVSGETTKALAILRVLNTRTSDPRVDALIARASSKSPGQTSSGMANSRYLSAIADISSLLPGSIAQFVPGVPSQQKGDVVLPYSPVTGSAASTQVQRATFEVHDRKTAKAAQGFLSKTIKRAYLSNQKLVRVGTQAAYFGTDAGYEAVAAFARGRYAFVVVVSAQPGIEPASLQAVSVQLASTFPAAK